MAEQITLYQRTQQLLSPKPCLYPKLFYDNNMMQEKVRQTLLIKALDVYNKVFASLPGVELEDVFLTGSSVSYQWREESDFDIKILLKINYNKFFIKNKKRAEFILGKMLKEHLNKQRSYRYENRYVDIGFIIERQVYFYGNYSLIYNTWVYIPDKKITSNLTTDEVYNTVIDKIFYCRKFMDTDLVSMNYDKKITAIKSIKDELSKMDKKQYDNILELIVSKLLKHEKIRKEIICFCNDNLLDILSIKGEE